jgi:hypothetical protein
MSILHVVVKICGSFVKIKTRIKLEQGIIFFNIHILQNRTVMSLNYKGAHCQAMHGAPLYIAETTLAQIDQAVYCVRNTGMSSLLDVIL